MFKEIKLLIFLITISLFLLLTGKYYFSDNNKKHFYRSINSIDKKNSVYAEQLPILENDTKNIIEYTEPSQKKKMKKFNFWKLIDSNE
jgi:hypothetical protein